MKTKTAELKKKLEDEADVQFIKDDELGCWDAVLDGKLLSSHGVLSVCVQLAAKELGE